MHYRSWETLAKQDQPYGAVQREISFSPGLYGHSRVEINLLPSSGCRTASTAAEIMDLYSVRFDSVSVSHLGHVTFQSEALLNG